MPALPVLGTCVADCSNCAAYCARSSGASEHFRVLTTHERDQAALLDCARLRPNAFSRLALVVTLAALATASRTARATPGITGYSGKPYSGVDDTCSTNCHGGNGTPPTLNITVPSTMKAGETADVTIVVNGTRTRTSMNAALSDGVTATKGQNTDVPFPVETPGEVAAVTPPPNGANGTYKFTFVAPNKNGPITLWVAGMSASGSGTGGDGVATAKRTITVSGATAPANDAGSTDPDDAGTSPSPSDGGAGATFDASAPGSDDDDDESEGSGGRGRRVSDGDDGGGCSAAHAGGRDAGAAGAAALVAFALVVSRRRARARSR